MGKVGKNIKKIRNIKGLSQQAFADLFQLSRGNISSYEEGRAEPRMEVIVDIAKYFGISLDNFILKDLSVNELVHYNTEFVLEPEELKRTPRLLEIPYVPALYLSDYIANFNHEEFIKKLPCIIIPDYSRFGLIAIEVMNPEMIPIGFDFKNGDILFFENVVKENIHRIKGRFGMMVDYSGLKTGIFEEQNHEMVLYLNDLVKYPFDIASDAHYWVLKASYSQIN